ncbi:conserved hypothetical protein [Frigoribacterium sp. 9N]|nr:conserved hypothetical protein [Frigoribacterium sp. 9N]
MGPRRRRRRHPDARARSLTPRVLGRRGRACSVAEAASAPRDATRASCPTRASYPTVRR